ncbi:nose resistant to fluoxetine protein 6-like [Ornithodoros turicata]|uniref:nose resistant to fluoxetine protein 6-like n=1 Tax=Ornithodoros turicata TaxID=34597 RepID=UPI00313895E3
MARCWIFCCLLLVSGLVSVLADDYEDADDVSVEEEYARIDANMTQILDTVRKRINQELAPFIGDVIYDPRLEPQCAGALLKLGLGIQNLDHWAIEMVDASGKPPSGALRGRLGDYGSYDECLKVRHPRGSFQGRYCMLHVKIKPTPLMLELAKKFMDYHDINYVGNFTLMSRSRLKDQFPGFKLGVCIPSTCQQEDLQFIIDTTIRKYGIILEVSNCMVEEPLKVDQRQRVILCVFGSWLLLILAGTAYDIFLRWITPDKLSLSEKPKERGVLSKVARSFSLVRNTRKLLSVSSKAGSSSELGVIHGIRVLSALWVVLGHSYIFLDPHNDGGLMYLLENINSNFLFSVQMNSFLAVESFFTMTGFLMSYLAVKNYHPGVPVLLVVPMTLFRRYISSRFVLSEIPMCRKMVSSD